MVCPWSHAHGVNPTIQLRVISGYKRRVIKVWEFSGTRNSKWASASPESGRALNHARVSSSHCIPLSLHLDYVETCWLRSHHPRVAASSSPRPNRNRRFDGHRFISNKGRARRHQRPLNPKPCHHSHYLHALSWRPDQPRRQRHPVNNSRQNYAVAGANSFRRLPGSFVFVMHHAFSPMAAPPPPADAAPAHTRGLHSRWPRCWRAASLHAGHVHLL